MTKLEQILIVIVIILLLLLGILGFVFFRDNVTKKELKKDLDNAINDLKTLNNSISNGNNLLDKSYFESIDNINSYLSTNTNFSNYDSNAHVSFLQIGTNKYAVHYSDDSNNAEVIENLLKINNDLNRTLMEERAKRTEIMSNLAAQTANITTNLTTTKDKIDKLEVTKTLSWAAGISASWDGMIKDEMAYSIGVHGLMFIKNKVYIGLEVGIAKQVTINPSVGILLGYKFN